MSPPPNIADPLMTSTLLGSVASLMTSLLSEKPPMMALILRTTFQSAGTIRVTPPKMHSIVSSVCPSGSVACVRSISVPPKILLILPPLNTWLVTLCFDPLKIFVSLMYPSPVIVASCVQSGVSTGHAFHVLTG